MLTVRNAQLRVLAANAESELLSTAIAHLREQIGVRLAPLSDGSLRKYVSDGLCAGRGYELRTVRDLLRFLNLLVLFGWEFAEPRENNWMRAYLADPDAGSPSARLERLIQECLRRADLERSGARLRQEFAP